MSTRAEKQQDAAFRRLAEVTASLASAQQRIEALERALGELVAWRPIEKAPKDGSEVLLRVKARAGVRGKCLVGHYMEGGHCIEDHPPIAAGWYFWDGRMFDRASEPVEWMPLPEPPEARAIGTREGGDANAAPGRSPESAVATATRPSKAYLRGISPQSAWPFAQDDKGSSKSSEP